MLFSLHTSQYSLRTLKETLTPGRFVIAVLVIILHFCRKQLKSMMYSVKSRHGTNTNSIVDDKPILAGATYLEVHNAFRSKNMNSILLKWWRRTGNIFQLRVPFSAMYVIACDPYLARRVLNDKTSKKLEGLESMQLFHDGGDDIFTSENEFWRYSRKGMAPAFSSTHVKRMKDIVASKVENFKRDTLNNYVESGESFDAGLEMMHLTLSVICSVAFEYEMSYEERNQFLRAFHITREEITKWRSPLALKFRSFIPSMAKSNAAGRELVALALKILESYRQLKSPIQGTVIDLIAKNQNYKSDRERANDIMMMLLAGHDSTAYTAAWTLFELSRNPVEQEKLRYELNSKSLQDPTKSELLDHVIKESFRLNPVVSIGSPRVLSRDVHVQKNELNGLQRDVMIPKGSIVVFPQILLGRNPKVFDDPETFKPSRWASPSEQAIASYMPFAMGRRNCIGQTLAMCELNLILAILCPNFKFTVENEGTAAFSLTTIPVGVRLCVSKV